MKNLLTLINIMLTVILFSCWADEDIKPVMSYNEPVVYEEQADEPEQSSEPEQSNEPDAPTIKTEEKMEPILLETDEGTIKLTKTELSGLHENVLNSVIVELLVEDTGVITGAEIARVEAIITDPKGGSTTLNTYKTQDGWKTAYMPKVFGDTNIKVKVYEQTDPEDVETLNVINEFEFDTPIVIDTWFVRTLITDLQIHERVDLLGLEPGVVTSFVNPSPNVAGFGSHDTSFMFELRIPQGKKMRFLAWTVKETDNNPYFGNVKVDVHFRLKDYLDRYEKHTGNFSPADVLDIETEKHIDSADWFELESGLHLLYVVPSNYGDKTMVYCEYQEVREDEGAIGGQVKNRQKMMVFPGE